MVVAKRKSPFFLSIDKTKVSDKNFEILITLLSRASSLRSLRVSNTGITLQPATVDKNLQNFLKKTQIQNLNLSSNKIGLDGILALSQSLVFNKSLVKLNLSKN
jgi:Ran GTPase-activating protein (RanGAP) involved in mRNA processing and transport